MHRISWLMALLPFLFCACGREAAAPLPSLPPAGPTASVVPVESPAPPTSTPAASPAPLPAVSPTPAPTRWVLYTADDQVQLRGGPGTGFAILNTLPRGCAVTCLGQEGEWIMVDFAGQTGYTREDLLGTERLPAQPASVTSPRITVKKSERLLWLWDGNRLAGEYPIGLGWAPEGHKSQEGDGRTPEGSYYVCTRNGSSRYYLSLGLSYPNAEDAAAALASGRIDAATCDRIVQAIAAGGRPPWDTPLGGEIMIHGHGSSQDWTAGCIAVDDAIMDILWAFCPIGTEVQILP